MSIPTEIYCIHQSYPYISQFMLVCNYAGDLSFIVFFCYGYMVIYLQYTPYNDSHPIEFTIISSILIILLLLTPLCKEEGIFIQKALLYKEIQNIQVFNIHGSIYLSEVFIIVFRLLLFYREIW